MRFDELKDAVEHAIGEVQSKFNGNLGIIDMDRSSIDSEVIKEYDYTIDRVAELIWKQAELTNNPVGAYYASEADITFLLQDHYENGSLISQECVGWYYGQPDDSKTKLYAGSIKAEYTKDDHYLRGAER